MKVRSILILTVSFLLILLLSFMVFTVLPVGSFDFNPFGSIKLGKDLGGSYVVTLTPKTDVSDDDISKCKEVLEGRLLMFNQPDTSISTQGSSMRIEFPYNKTNSPAYLKDISESVYSPGDMSFVDGDGYTLMEKLEVEKAMYTTSKSRSSDEVTYTIYFELKDDYKSEFQKVTEKSKGSEMVLMIDGKAVFSVAISQAISDGICGISGVSRDEAAEILQQLNKGTLPYEVSVTSQEYVSPYLGYNAYVYCCIVIAFAAVLLMIVLTAVYRTRAIVADFSILFFLSLTVFLIALFEMRFTSGTFVALLIGMALLGAISVIILSSLKNSSRGPVESAKLLWKRPLVFSLDICLPAMVLFSIVLTFAENDFLYFSQSIVLCSGTALICALFIMIPLLNADSHLRKAVSNSEGGAK